MKKNNRKEIINNFVNIKEITDQINLKITLNK